MHDVSDDAALTSKICMRPCGNNATFDEGMPPLLYADMNKETLFM